MNVDISQRNMARYSCKPFAAIDNISACSTDRSIWVNKLVPIISLLMNASQKAAIDGYSDFSVCERFVVVSRVSTGFRASLGGLFHRHLSERRLDFVGI